MLNCLWSILEIITIVSTFCKQDKLRELMSDKNYKKLYKNYIENCKFKKKQFIVHQALTKA